MCRDPRGVRVGDVRGNEALSILVDGHLDTVSFVMDYVEFRIGYSVLRALVPPAVRLHDGTEARFPEQGSRDALCRLIDTEVAGAAQTGAERLEVRTGRGDLLVIDGSDFPIPSSRT